MRKLKTPVRMRTTRPRKRWLAPFKELDDDDDDLIIGGGADEVKDIAVSSSSGK
jgi:hypothetical protein